MMDSSAKARQSAPVVSREDDGDRPSNAQASPFTRPISELPFKDGAPFFFPLWSMSTASVTRPALS